MNRQSLLALLLFCTISAVPVSTIHAQGLEEGILTKWEVDAAESKKLGELDDETLDELVKMKVQLELKRDGRVIVYTIDPSSREQEGKWSRKKVDEVRNRIVVSMEIDGDASDMVFQRGKAGIKGIYRSDGIAIVFRVAKRK